MANPPQLYVTTKRTPIQVFIQSSALTLTQEGSDVDLVTDDFPTQDDGATFEQHNKPQPRVAEAFGKVFFLYENTVRERDEGGAGNWGTVYTLSFTPAGGKNTGLQIVHVNGQETLCFLYTRGLATGSVQAVYTSDGANWTEVEAYSKTSSGNGVRTSGTCISYQSSLIWCAGMDKDLDGGNSNLGIYDFELGTYTQILSTGAGEPTGGNTTQGLCDIAIYNNTIFKAAGGSSTSLLLRLDGVGWTNVYSSTNHIHASSVNIPSSAEGAYKIIFSDPTTGNLVMIATYSSSGGSGNLGLYCIRFTADILTASGLDDSDDPASLEDISATVLPLALRPIGVGGSHPTDEVSVVEIFVDTVTTPGTPVVFVLTATRQFASDTFSWQYWQWNGVGSLMTLVGTSGAVGATHVPSLTHVGGGERIPTAGSARPVWDGGTVVTHGAVTSGPFVAGEPLTSSGTGVGFVRTVYSSSLDIEITSGEFLDTEVITGGTSGATATLSADSIDLSTPTEETGGRTKVYFRVQGTGSAIGLQVYYSGDSEAPDTLMDLVASTVTVEAGTPSTVPTNTTSQISNVTPDSGATIYSIQLETTAAGIISGQGYSLMIVPV